MTAKQTMREMAVRIDLSLKKLTENSIRFVNIGLTFARMRGNTDPSLEERQR